MTQNLPIYRLSLAKIQAIDDPFKYCPWGFKTPISTLEIARALSEYKFLSPEHGQKMKYSRQENIEKIAWFAGFGWSDPILLGRLDSKSIQIIDGARRLRAAYVRGDNEIKAQIFEDKDSSTSLSLLKNFLV